MKTEAQKRSTNKFHKTHIKQFNLKLHKTIDKDIIDYLESLENKQGYLKDLIRKDMDK